MPRRLAFARFVAGTLAAVAAWPLAVALTWGDVTITTSGGSPWAGVLSGWTPAELLAVFGIVFLEASSIRTAAQGLHGFRAGGVRA